MTRMWLVVLALTIGLSSVAGAQKVAKPNIMFDGEGIVNWEFFINQPSVAKLLELTRYQQDEISEFKEANCKKHSEKSFAVIEDGRLSEQEKSDALAETFRDTRNKFVARLNRILLPVQKDELQDVAIGQIFSRAKMSKLVRNSLHTEGFAEDKVDIAFDEAKKIELELETKISQARKNAWAKITGAIGGGQANSISNGLQIGGAKR